jgi:hypothetical protein
MTYYFVFNRKTIYFLHTIIQSISMHCSLDDYVIGASRVLAGKACSETAARVVETYLGDIIQATLLTKAVEYKKQYPNAFTGEHARTEIVQLEAYVAKLVYQTYGQKLYDESRLAFPAQMGEEVIKRALAQHTLLLATRINNDICENILSDVIRRPPVWLGHH